MVVAFCLCVILFRINDITRPGMWRVIVVLAPWLCILMRDLYSGSPTPDSVLYVMVVLALAALWPDPRRVLVTPGVFRPAHRNHRGGIRLPPAKCRCTARLQGSAFQRSDKTVFPSLGLLGHVHIGEQSGHLHIDRVRSGGDAATLVWLRLSGLGTILFAVLWSSSRSSMFALASMLVIGTLVWAVGNSGRAVQRL